MAQLYRVDSPINREQRNNINLTFEDIRQQVGSNVLNVSRIKDQLEQSFGSLQNQVNELVVNGDSSPEAAQARVGSDGTVYPTLNDRIDGEVELIKEKQREVIYDLLDEGADPTGNSDCSVIFQGLASNPNVTIRVRGGNFLISNPIKLAKGVRIEFYKDGFITLDGDSDLFKVNYRCEIYGANILVPKYKYAGNVFEISKATIDQDSESCLEIIIDGTNIEFDPYTNYTDKTGTVFLIYSSSVNEGSSPNTFVGDGFWNVKINNSKVKGGVCYFVRMYETKSDGSWITGVYFDKNVLDAGPKYGFFGSKGESTISDPSYTDGEMIYYTGNQMQNSKAKYMYYFTRGLKSIKNNIAWDWQYAPETTDRPITFLYRPEYVQPINLDGEYGAISSRMGFVGFTGTPSDSDFYRYISGYTTFYESYTPNIKKSDINGLKIYYIDSVNGSDSNNGLSNNRAFKTFRGAVDNTIGSAVFNIIGTLSAANAVVLTDRLLVISGGTLNIQESISLVNSTLQFAGVTINSDFASPCIRTKGICGVSTSSNGTTNCILNVLRGNAFITSENYNATLSIQVANMVSVNLSYLTINNTSGSNYDILLHGTTAKITNRFLRFSGVTKPSNVFWSEGSDTLTQIGTTGVNVL